MKKIIYALIFLLMFGSVCFAQDTEYDSVMLYSTWDADYLYIGCQVQTPSVNAKSVQFNVPIGDDDGIEIVADLSHSGKKHINSACYSFSASAAGGFEFRHGNDEGVWVQENIFSHKIQCNVLGTLNNSNDIDNGYIIEIALPWEKLGGFVPDNKMISFSFKIRAGGKEYALTDLKEFNNPSSWFDMLLATYTSSFVTKVQNRIMCGTYISVPPVIDGNIKKGEWNAKTAYELKIPIDKNIYQLSFKSQKVIVKELALAKGESFLNSPLRADVIKNEIINLEPVDVVCVADTADYLRVVEGVKAYNGEKNTSVPIMPLIHAENTEELIAKINDFLCVVPPQLRFIITNENADRTLHIRTDLKNIDHSLLDSVFTGFVVSTKQEFAIDSRITSEYAYVITNYISPISISADKPDQFNFTVKNVGSMTWKPVEMSLSYKWFRNDRFYSQGFMPIPITKEVKPGETYSFSTALLPVDSQNKPFAPGDVVVEAEIIHSEGDKLLTSQPFMFRTAISEENSAEGLKIIDTDIAKIMEPDINYEIMVRAQNSTGYELKTGDEIFVHPVLLDAEGNIEKEYAKERFSLYLAEDTPIGIEGLFRGIVKFSPGRGDNIKSFDRNYALVFSYKKDSKFVPFYKEKINFADNDFNQKLVLLSKPEEVKKGTEGLYKIVVRNAGEHTWNKDASLVADWYDGQGKLTDKGTVMQISRNKIKPGEVFMKEMNIPAPKEKGLKYLVITLCSEGRNFSFIDMGRTNNMIAVPIDTAE
ncbi:MAG: hypothetical protein KBT47_05650 [Armatimonadetes bacterium]|nr:hypothetical protein [Candidatus Hippobium faecium]